MVIAVSGLVIGLLLVLGLFIFAIPSLTESGKVEVQLGPDRFDAGPVDDRAETIAERLREYADKTAPLVDYYGAQGKLVGIDATGPVEDVTVRAIDALRSYGG